MIVLTKISMSYKANIMLGNIRIFSFFFKFLNLNKLYGCKSVNMNKGRMEIQFLVKNLIVTSDINKM